MYHVSTRNNRMLQREVHLHHKHFGKLILGTNSLFDIKHLRDRRRGSLARVEVAPDAQYLGGGSSIRSTCSPWRVNGPVVLIF